MNIKVICVQFLAISFWGSGNFWVERAKASQPTMLVNTIALQEAKTSTAIENIFTTEDELYKAISDTAREERANPATKEVLKYRDALWKAYRQLQYENSISIDLVIHFFQQIKETTAGLRPPQAQVVIRQGQSEFRTGRNYLYPAGRYKHS